MEIEVELKSESPLLEKKECFCGKEALRTVKIGRVQDSYGTEYDICGSPDCLDTALDNEIDDIQYRNTHKDQLAYDLVEGD